MASMGKKSLTTKAWKASGCLAAEIQFLGRKTKRATKGQNAAALRRQATKEIGNQDSGART